MSVLDHDTTEESLGIENTIWAGAVVASGTATGKYDTTVDSLGIENTIWAGAVVDIGTATGK